MQFEAQAVYKCITVMFAKQQQLAIEYNVAAT